MGFSRGSCLHSGKLKTSPYDARLCFFPKGNEFVIIAIVVDEIEFASNSTHLMPCFKEKLSAKLNFKLLGTLSSFIGWQLSKGHDHIKVNQMRYAESLFLTHRLDQANSVLTLLLLNV